MFKYVFAVSLFVLQGCATLEEKSLSLGSAKEKCRTVSVSKTETLEDMKNDKDYDKFRECSSALLSVQNSTIEDSKTVTGNVIFQTTN